MSVELSVVLPAFNSAAWLASSLETLLTYLGQRAIGAEVIVVDDGSTDDTAGVAARHSSDVRVVRLPRNQGKGAALRAGMAVATGRVRAFTDADLPYGPEPLELVMRYIDERGFHAAFGDRTLPGSTYAHAGAVRTAVSGAAGIAFRTLVTAGFADTQCGLKGFRGDVADALFPLTTVDRFAIDVELIYLLLKYRLEIKRIPVELARNAPSSVHVARDGWQAVRDIATMRLDFARGRYRDDRLAACLAADLAADRERWGMPNDR